ncbi:MAG: hypothetical protein JXR63_09490 [Spirochaetales bacterium]|nr:hypothetical protein [Spirochaetales bacterium]
MDKKSFLESNLSARDFLEEKEQLWEMANLRPVETGLPMVIWVSPATGREQHSPRIKVQSVHGDRLSPDRLCSVSISLDPKLVAGSLSAGDCQIVFSFVKKNYELLMQYWRSEITTTEFVKSFQKY